MPVKYLQHADERVEGLLRPIEFALSVAGVRLRAPRPSTSAMCRRTASTTAFSAFTAEIVTWWAQSLVDGHRYIG